MTSAFFGLGIGSSALQAAQAQVNVTNQNIANANTPGYSRQTAAIVASQPFPAPTYNSQGVVGQMGTGVQVTAITRARDAFVDAQMRTQLTSQGQADTRTAALATIEATVNEPSTTGLSATLTAYWNSWQEVANTPSDSSIRASAIQAGVAVADVFQSTVQQYKAQQQDLDSQVSGTVTTVNTDAEQIAALNTQIAQVQATGNHANDLSDQRDLLVDQLSSLVKITTLVGADGQMSINVGNHQLVDRGNTHAMQATVSSSTGFTQVDWTDGSAVSVGGGQLQGMIDSRDTLLPERISDINTLASRVIASVNSLSQSGVGLDGKGGRDFFSGTNATDIAVNPVLTATAGGTDFLAAARMVADPTAASGYSSATGDSSNALAIAELGNMVAQAKPGSLATKDTLGPATVTGVDLSGAAPGATYTFSVVAGSPPTVSVNDGTNTTQATLTVGADSAGNQIITVDTGTTRLTLSALAPPTTTESAALAGLQGKTITTLAGPSTIGDEYAQQIASLGVESATAKSQSANQTALISTLTTQRDQVSGVSLDEETVNLMMYQKAYDAAARIITTMDGMLDTLINHTGTGT